MGQEAIWAYIEFILKFDALLRGIQRENASLVETGGAYILGCATRTSCIQRESVPFAAHKLRENHLGSYPWITKFTIQSVFSKKHESASKAASTKAPT